MERRLLLDVVVTEGAAVLELLARKDEALLVGRDALLVLDLLLYVVDRVRRLDVERDGLAREGLDEDLCGRDTRLSSVFVCAAAASGSAPPLSSRAAAAASLAAGGATGPMRSVANQRTDPWVFQCAGKSGYDAQRAPGRPNAAKLCFLRYSRPAFRGAK